MKRYPQKTADKKRRIIRGLAAIKLQEDYGLSARAIGEKWDVTDTSVHRYIREAQQYLKQKKKGKEDD